MDIEKISMEGSEQPREIFSEEAYNVGRENSSNNYEGLKPAGEIIFNGGTGVKYWM